MSVTGTVEAKKVIKGKIRVLPAIDETLTKRGRCADAKVTGEALDARVKKVDIVDCLTSDAADKPLSARQGAELKKMIDALSGNV